MSVYSLSGSDGFKIFEYVTYERKKERERVHIATTVTILFVAVYSSIKNHFCQKQNPL
jgi:hypothetical protein